MAEAPSAVVAGASATHVLDHTIDAQQTGDGATKAAGSVLPVGETADPAQLVPGDGAMERQVAQPLHLERP